MTLQREKKCSLLLSSLTALLTICLHARAGESGLNVIVVVNQNSSNSVQLGNDYCEKRGVPPQNFFRITNFSGGSIDWSQSVYESYLLNPLLAMISSRGLSNQAHVILLSMDIPYRTSVGGNGDGTTSTLFYGFKLNTPPPPGLPDTCSLPEDSTNSYSYSELPFTLAEPATATTNAFLAVMLTDTNLADAESTLARGVASDGTFPAQTIYLEKTSDTDRNVRFILFDNAIQECRARNDNGVMRVDSDSTSWTNALGLETGLADYTFATNAFVPGAVGDTLTSFAGAFFENTGQTPLFAFLEAGACGSYGTVVEPCNYTWKFPDPMVYFYQNRGFCFAEAYYQSLPNPYEGVMVGEPLSAPFARPGSGVWNSPAAGSMLSGSAACSLSFTAADTNHPLAQVDLFVDGTFFETITNLPPSAGNVYSVNFGGASAHYTVTNGDTLASIALGLASAVEVRETNTGIMADAVGDRVLLRSLNVSPTGSQISVQPGATQGSAAALTSFAATPLPTFVDSTAYGYHELEAGNNPQVGDWLQMTITKTNGTKITVAVTNEQSGAGIDTLLQNLMNQINDTPALQTADGVNAGDLLETSGGFYFFILYANSPGWPAAQIQTDFTGSPDLDAQLPGTNGFYGNYPDLPANAGLLVAEEFGTNGLYDNYPDLLPRAQVYLSSGASSLTVPITLNTTLFADGYHTLTAVAYEGTSVRTQTRATQTVQFHNTPLSATFAAMPPDTNGNPQFAIAANETNIANITLFSTGGSMAVATNQAAVKLAAPAATLGTGLHPFYAVVTDASGHAYQTPTVWEQVPVMQLSVSGSPPILTWASIVGRQYNILSATNLLGEYQAAGSVLATNSRAQWTVPVSTAGCLFYKVLVTP